jgi:hypothetical protein
MIKKSASDGGSRANAAAVGEQNASVTVNTHGVSDSDRASNVAAYALNDPNGSSVDNYALGGGRIESEPSLEYFHRNGNALG